MCTPLQPGSTSPNLHNHNFLYPLLTCTTPHPPKKKLCPPLTDHDSTHKSVLRVAATIGHRFLHWPHASSGCYHFASVSRLSAKLRSPFLGVNISSYHYQHTSVPTLNYFFLLSHHVLLLHIKFACQPGLVCSLYIPRESGHQGPFILEFPNH